MPFSSLYSTVEHTPPEADTLNQRLSYGVPKVNRVQSDALTKMNSILLSVSVWYVAYGACPCCRGCVHTWWRHGILTARYL